MAGIAVEAERTWRDCGVLLICVYVDVDVLMHSDVCHDYFVLHKIIMGGLEMTLFVTPV